MKLYKIVNKIKLRRYIKRGLKVGKNFVLESRVHLDAGFPYLIEIGNDVTLAPEVTILAHDASGKKIGGYTSVSKVKIGNNVFVGAKTIILHGINIGDNVIIGAGSVVTKNIPSNSVVCGNPARVIKKISEFKENKNNEYENGLFIKNTELKTYLKDKKMQEKLKIELRDNKIFIDEKTLN